MAGYTGEKRWRKNMNLDAPTEGVSELGRSVCRQMIDALTDAEAAYAELQELYTFAGSTVAGLADQLFIEDIAARTTPGTNAVVTVDVTSGVITAATIDTAGTGYTDGNYQLDRVALDNGGSNGILNYTVSGGVVTAVTVIAGGTGYSDGLGQTVTSFPLAGGVSDTSANAEEIAKTQALFDAITALHELYLAADNTVVAQEDRLGQIRRMT